MAAAIPVAVSRLYIQLNLPQAYAWGYMLWPLRGLTTLSNLFSKNTVWDEILSFSPLLMRTKSIFFKAVALISRSI